MLFTGKGLGIMFHEERMDFIKHSLGIIKRQTFSILSEKFHVDYRENLHNKTLEFALIYDNKILSAASGKMDDFSDHTISDMMTHISTVFAGVLETFFIPMELKEQQAKLTPNEIRILSYGKE